ncbi:MAG: RidA family protein [Planctomycetaceae bacterium]|nr:RidA family protein [Planctomycetaceae bacterium]
MSTPEEKLAALGYPPEVVPSPGAIYRQVAVTGNIAYVSGAVPMEGDELLSKGKVPSQVSLEEAQVAAGLCVANNLRMLKKEIGSLDRVEEIIRLTGYVYSEPDFTDQHLVINGASKVLLEVFGDSGLAARTAIGLAALPLGSSVETEIIVKLKDE